MGAAMLTRFDPLKLPRRRGRALFARTA